jgi:hypothetical protein
MHAIICDARKGENLGIDTLALVDRGKTREFWWTSDRPELILGYRKESAAKFALSRLKLNNPRIVPLEEAERIIGGQRRAIHAYENDRLHNEAAIEMEQGWDGHKIWRD